MRTYFCYRLKEISDRINRLGTTPAIPALQNLRGVQIRAIAISTTHIALLLNDGRICRVQFSVIPERLDLTRSNDTKTGTTGGSGSAGGATTATTSSQQQKQSSSSGRQLTRRARIMRSTTAIRGSSSGGTSSSRAPSGGVIIGTSSSGNASGGGSGTRQMVAVPAPYVPEELVSQAQVVLQGKSRNLIIRELQVSLCGIRGVVRWY